MGIVINSCVTGMHGMCLYSYLLCVHTLSTISYWLYMATGKLTYVAICIEY